MTTATKLSHSAALASVARTLGEDVSLSMLVISAWRMYPDLFGLPGAPQYPSDNRVIACLSSRNGPIARGEIVRVGPNRYRAATTAEQNGCAIPDPTPKELDCWRHEGQNRAVLVYLQRIGRKGHTLPAAEAQQRFIDMHALGG